MTGLIKTQDARPVMTGPRNPEREHSMMTFPRKARVGARAATALVGLALFVAGCGSSSSSSSSSASAAGNSAASTSGAGVSISTAKGAGGIYLTGASGRALYLWDADKGDKSVCDGACATAWPPLLTKSLPSAGGGVNAADLGTTVRSDGTKQVTYKGHPLYYFIADTSAGKLTGQGSNSFGAKWWLVAPSGAALTGGSASAGSSSGGSTNHPTGY
jgi:predicted lipoprotein with Yx(FWY)xxD motif